MKILLVEDDPDALLTLQQGLNLSFPTFTLKTAQSAEQAEEVIAAGFVPGLVITDVRLPGRSGIDLLLDLERRHPNLQFILMSGFSPPEIPQQAEQDRLLRFLPKPFELAQLVAEVQSAFVRDQFSGSHQAITFIDILQVLNMSQKTARLELRRDSAPVGGIYLVLGEIHHAEFGELEGEPAFLKLCQSPDLTFRVRSGERAPTRTIERPFSTLLIDVMGEE